MKNRKEPDKVAECKKILRQVEQHLTEIQAMHKDMEGIKALMEKNQKLYIESERKQQQEIQQRVIKMASKAAKKAAKKSITKARIREAFKQIEEE